MTTALQTASGLQCEPARHMREFPLERLDCRMPATDAANDAIDAAQINEGESFFDALIENPVAGFTAVADGIVLGATELLLRGGWRSVPNSGLTLHLSLLVSATEPGLHWPCAMGPGAHDFEIHQAQVFGVAAGACRPQLRPMLAVATTLEGDALRRQSCLVYRWSGTYAQVHDDLFIQLSPLP